MSRNIVCGCRDRRLKPDQNLAMTFMHWIASGGGIGRFPYAPGTVASLAAIPIGAVALWLDPRILILLAIATCVIGVWAVHETNARDDPGWIVIDEFAGQWIAMLGLGRVSLYGLVAAFVLFRFFDITKLGPVGWADRKDGAIGVMADDVVAGLIVAALLFVVTTFAPIIVR
jgi:phosphatidylglycerophosphatase A